MPEKVDKKSRMSEKTYGFECTRERPDYIVSIISAVSGL